MMRDSFPVLRACLLGALSLVACAEAGGGSEPGDLCEIVECDDDNDCTVDSCDAADPRVCIFTDHPLDSPCEGGLCDGFGHCVECTGDEQCAIEDRNDCTASACDLALGECNPLAPVADGAPCAGGACVAGACVLEGTVLPCTEQGVLNAIAAGGGPYTFDCAGPSKVSTAAEIVIENDVILDGEGKLTLDGAGEHSIFHVPVGVTAELHGFSLSNGVHGVNWNLGTLTLERCVVSDHSQGGIRNFGQMTLTDSTVTGNQNTGTGGGILSDGELSIYRSTVSGNSAASGGGIFVHSGLVTLVNSTVSRNSAELDGGGIHTNQALVLIHSTVAENEAPSASGIFIDEFAWMRSSRSIIDGECAGPPGLIFEVDSQGYNLETPGDTCDFGRATDQADINAEDLSLGSLADNGGPTMTHALLPGSVAIDAIPEAECIDSDGEPLTSDQRGVPRPQGGACDLGAFELEE